MYCVCPLAFRSWSTHQMGNRDSQESYRAESWGRAQTLAQLWLAIYQIPYFTSCRASAFRALSLWIPVSGLDVSIYSILPIIFPLSISQFYSISIRENQMSDFSAFPLLWQEWVTRSASDSCCDDVGNSSEVPCLAKSQMKENITVQSTVKPLKI